MIRYYYLAGYAVRIENGEEICLTHAEFNDFILNQKKDMVAGEESYNFKYQEYHPKV